MTNISYTEDSLIEQLVIALFAKLGWQITNLEATRNLLLSRLVSREVDVSAVEI